MRIFELEEPGPHQGGEDKSERDEPPKLILLLRSLVWIMVDDGRL